MSAALFDLDNDGTLEILISRANIKKITRVTVAEPGRKTAKIFLPDVPPLESEWELNPGRCTCEHFRCKKCHFINCVAVKYCGECGARMKNAGVKPEDLPLPALDEYTPEQIEAVKEEIKKNYQQFLGWVDDGGEEFAYDRLRRVIEDIYGVGAMVERVKGEEPVFGEPLFKKDF